MGPGFGFFLFVPFTKLPAEPRLLDLFSSATSRVIRPFRPWGYQSGSERVSPLTCFASSYFRSDPTPYQRRISRTSVQPRRKGYLPKTSSWVGAQRTLEAETSTLVLPTARSVAPRPEHVLVQTALTPTLSQWVPALIHPHVTLDPCTPLGVQSLQLSGDSDSEPSRHAPSP